jgi:hypothetical protein
LNRQKSSFDFATKGNHLVLNYMMDPVSDNIYNSPKWGKKKIVLAMMKMISCISLSQKWKEYVEIGYFPEQLSFILIYLKIIIGVATIQALSWIKSDKSSVSRSSSRATILFVFFLILYDYLLECYLMSFPNFQKNTARRFSGSLTKSNFFAIQKS